MTKRFPMRVVLGAVIMFVGSMHAAYDVGQEIRAAAAQGCNDRLQELLREYPGLVNVADEDGCTPLYHAMNDKGDVGTVDVLVRAGAQVDAPEKHFGATPLIIAVALGKEENVKALLTAKASVNRKQAEGATALHAAVRGGHEKVISLLIEAQAGVDIHSKCFRVTPLMFAVNSERKDIVEMLLAAKASVDLEQLEGGTALRIAVQKQNSDIVSVLLEAQASVDVADINGFTPLMAAADNGNKGIVEQLLAARASVSVKDNDECTALMYAQNKGHQDVVTLLASAQERDGSVSEASGQVSLWNVTNCVAQ